MNRTAMKVLVFLGSNRPGRNGERVAKFVSEYLTKKGHNVDIADSMKLGLPLLENPIHFYPDPSKAPQAVIDFNKQVQDADAYVVLTGEYNRKMPAAITNLLDHPKPSSFAFKISGIVSYSLGPGGGSTAAMDARRLMVELGAPPVPFILSIGQVTNALDADGNPLEKEAEKMQNKMGQFYSQFEWYATALNNHRETTGIP